MCRTRPAGSPPASRRPGDRRRPCPAGRQQGGAGWSAVVEVVEHLDPPRLRAFERVLFESARPGTVVLTTPNREFNVTWESLPAGRFRHADHRFEWTRREFRDWATGVAARFGYAVRFLPVGPEHPEYGPPTQMGVFSHVRGDTPGGESTGGEAG